MKSGTISNFDKIDNDSPKIDYQGDLKWNLLFQWRKTVSWWRRQLTGNDAEPV